MRVAALVLLAVLAGGWYAALCAGRPLVRCRSCRGAMVRRRRGPAVIVWLLVRFRGVALCPRCRGRGTRIRLGRRAYDKVRELQRAGTR